MSKKFREGLILRPFIVQRENGGKQEFLSADDGLKLVWSKDLCLGLRMTETRADSTVQRAGGEKKKIG